MISVITCINNEEIYERMLLKSLKEANNLLLNSNLKELEIIKVKGSDYSSLAHAYNAAQKTATFKIKAFIHEDLDLLEPDWVFKLLQLLEDSTFGLIGMLATTKIDNDSFFWFDKGTEYIYAKAFIYPEKAELNYLDPINWTKDTILECLDGIFMATTLDYLPFDETLLIKDGHFMPLYEQDICNYIRFKKGLKLGLLNHICWHLSNTSNTEELLNYIRQNSAEVLQLYKQKWNLI